MTEFFLVASAVHMWVIALALEWNKIDGSIDGEWAKVAGVTTALYACVTLYILFVTWENAPYDATYTHWSPCVDGQHSRTCLTEALNGGDNSACLKDSDGNYIVETEACTPPPPPPPPPPRAGPLSPPSVTPPTPTPTPAPSSTRQIDDAGCDVAELPLLGWCGSKMIFWAKAALGALLPAHSERSRLVLTLRATMLIRSQAKYSP